MSSMLGYLGNLNDSKITGVQRTGLSSRTRNMQTSKAPGHEGFLVESYKRFPSQQTPLLLNMFNYSLEQSALPQTLTEAASTVLLKSGKDEVDCG